MERRQKILALARAAEANFSSSEWTEVGYLTATDEWIDRHPRLLRSLQWGDSDYKGRVFDAIAHILDKDEGNLKRLIEYEPIATWLKTNEPGLYQALLADGQGVPVPDVVPIAASEAVLAALADAQALLENRGPTSAVDRVHTGLHGFLKAVCYEAGIAFDADATPNQLLRLLLEQHPRLADFGPRGQEVRRLIRTSASIVDAMGTLRNRASLAHPNEDLLDHDEALLVINLARSLLRFLDAKLSK